MKRLILVLVLLSTPLYAEEPTPLKWSDHEQIPTWISDALVITNLALDGVDAFRTNDREKWAFACRNGIAYGVSELLKRLVHRERPNDRDAQSFPSMHTALGTSSAGYQSAWGASFAVAIGWGRQAGGWHYASDVGVGAGIGLVSQRLCNTLIRQEGVTP